MDDTGRIREPLDWRARKIVFGNDAGQAIDDELSFYIQIDRAHVVMLVEQRVLSRDTGSRVLAGIDALVQQDYAPLRGRESRRGLYMLYERWLIETLGKAVGGATHLARSRNDINATVLRLRLRPVYYRLVREVLRLLVVLIRRAKRYAGLTMPIYTHYQAALPITYGHYLAGVALALLRDLWGIEDAARELDRSALGAGAAGGTTVPIDTERTARLLGFTRGVLHSVDAVASRDLVLRLLGSASVLGVTLSRLAGDLQLWSTAEFDLIRFPDRLVGSSSMMPQKRNPFLLEHIKGRSAAPLGAFTTAAVAMHATPFSNSVAVGTEGIRPLWNALNDVTEALVLTRLAVAGAQPQKGSMRRRASEGFTTATEVANRLVLNGGLSFRQAHYRIGRHVNSAAARRKLLESAAGAVIQGLKPTREAAPVDPRVVAASAVYGGGPAALGSAVTELRSGWTEATRRLASQVRRWTDGSRALHEAAADVVRAEPSLLPSRPAGSLAHAISATASAERTTRPTPPAKACS